MPVQCGQVDLAPTLLALLGVDPAPLPFLGRNLFGSPGDSPLVQRHGAWRTSTRIFLPTGTALEDGHCFDVRTLHRLPPAQCASGYHAARDATEISRDVIEYDLQVPLARALAGRVQASPF